MLERESPCVFPVVTDLLIIVSYGSGFPCVDGCWGLLGQWVTPGWPYQRWGSPIAQGVLQLGGSEPHFLLCEYGLAVGRLALRVNIPQYIETSAMGGSCCIEALFHLKG